MFYRIKPQGAELKQPSEACLTCPSTARLSTNAFFVADEGRVVERSVVPKGGLKSLTFNGRRRQLTLRRRLLLEHHDSDAQGVHPSAENTLLKLKELVWWPGMEADTQAWVAPCHTCRISTPQKGWTPEDRHDIYERPDRALFIDAVGPISPAPDGVPSHTHVRM